MEYREGDGMVLFCQMDVTDARKPTRRPSGWSEHDRLRVRLEADHHRQTLYAGDPAGRTTWRRPGYLRLRTRVDEYRSIRS